MLQTFEIEKKSNPGAQMQAETQIMCPDHGVKARGFNEKRKEIIT